MTEFPLLLKAESQSIIQTHHILLTLHLRMDTSIVSIPWRLWIMLRCTWENRCLFRILIFSFGCIPRSGIAGGSNGKESTCNAGDLGSIPGLGRSPGEGHGNPLQYSCLENPHGQSSLAGCGPWGLRVGHTWVNEHTHSDYPRSGTFVLFASSHTA